MRVPGCTMDMLVAIAAVGESKTKPEAAGKLGLSVSALDKRLKAASSLLGADLVLQGQVGIELTKAGHIFHAAALRSVEYALHAEESTRAHLLLQTKHLLVGHSAYLAPRLLGMIHQLRLAEHPDVRLDHKAGLTPSIVERVSEGTLHAGFGLLPVHAPALVVWKILEESLVVCLPETHTLSARAVIRGEDLQEQPVIAVGRETMPALHREIEEYLSSVGVELRIAADAFTPTEALVLVQQRVGLCILARSSALAHRGVVVRRLWTQAILRQSGFFFREDNRNPLVLELSRIVFQETEKLRRA